MKTPAARTADPTMVGPAADEVPRALPTAPPAPQLPVADAVDGPTREFLAWVARRPRSYAEAMEAFRLLCRTEGIIPAIETAHALAGARTLGERLGPDAVILVNLSGRGDKDVDTAAGYFGLIDSKENA